MWKDVSRPIRDPSSAVSSCLHRSAIWRCVVGLFSIMRLLRRVYLPVRCLFLCVVCFCSLFAPNLSISYFRFSVESLLLYCTIIHVLYRPFPKKNCLSEKRNSRRLTHSLSHPFAPCYLLLFPLITSLFDRRLNKSLIKMPTTMINTEIYTKEYVFRQHQHHCQTKAKERPSSSSS